MRSPIRAALVAILSISLAALGAPGLTPGDAAAADKLRVVATTTDLKALTEAVGGDLVEVEALARGNQNPHDLEVRPSLMVKVRRADLLVINGLELDQWAEVVVQGANNPKVLPGTPGRVDASEGLPILEVPTTQVDRSMGDVHPVGNPHYTPDPGHGAPDHRQYPERAGAAAAPVASDVREESRRVPGRARPGDDPAGPRPSRPSRAPRSSQYHPTSSTSSPASAWSRAAPSRTAPAFPPPPATWPASSRT